MPRAFLHAPPCTQHAPPALACNTTVERQRGVSMAWLHSSNGQRRAYVYVKGAVKGAVNQGHTCTRISSTRGRCKD
jgi:hypothetical protein